MVKPVPGWEFLRRFNSSIPARGGGDVQTTITQAQLATQQALTQRKSLLIDDVINLEHKPIFVCYTVPIEIRDRKAWLAFSGEIRRWLGNEYPTASPIFVSANGTPDPGLSGTYWIQCSVFFSLPEVPRPIRQRRYSQGLTRRATRQSPSNHKRGRRNGTVSADEAEMLGATINGSGGKL
jgi:hypothetical protein